MKLRYLIVFSVLFWVMGISAQDVITKTDGSKIDAKVEEITSTTIRYRNAANPTGPVYNISISTVANIRYQNGTIDNFTQPVAVQSPYVSKAPSSPAVSDYQLLNIYVDPEKLYTKAKRYRIAGWIGGGVIFAAALSAGIGLWIEYSSYCYYNDGPIYFAICAGPGLGAAAIWWMGFHFSANSLVKKARAAEMYSVNIVENEIYRFGDKSLTAGINLMGNQMTRTRGLGLSLSLNF